MEYLKVIVDRLALEFEIVEQDTNYELFALDIIEINKKTGSLVTCYNPCSVKNTKTLVIKDWTGRGFKHSKGIYQRMKDAANVE
jgi:hypothetical protein